MLEEASRLIDEILQIKNQYVDEVGAGRRVWPKSIKERMYKLDKLGLPAKTVADRTGIPYCTILLWRHRRKKPSKSGAFHELSVETRLPVVSKTRSVTVPKSEMPKGGGSLRLIMPNGFVIEGLDATGIISLVAAFSKAGHHVA